VIRSTSGSKSKDSNDGFSPSGDRLSSTPLFAQLFLGSQVSVSALSALISAFRKTDSVIFHVSDLRSSVADFSDLDLGSPGSPFSCDGVWKSHLALHGKQSPRVQRGEDAVVVPAFRLKESLDGLDRASAGQTCFGLIGHDWILVTSSSETLFNASVNHDHRRPVRPPCS
jgi:hypothetical protein